PSLRMNCGVAAMRTSPASSICVAASRARAAPSDQPTTSTPAGIVPGAPALPQPGRKTLAGIGERAKRQVELLVGVRRHEREAQPRRSVRHGRWADPDGEDAGLLERRRERKRAFALADDRRDDLRR